MSPFAKLDGKIIHSSLWSEPYHVRLVFVTMLAMKDEDGFVHTSTSGLQRAANVSKEECEDAIRVLESPDADSMTEADDGRRVHKVEGGWVVLNHDKYKTHEDKKKEYQREYMKRFRSKLDDVKLTEPNSELTSISVSDSESVSKEKIPPALEDVIEYCKERNNGIDAEKWYNFYSAKGWMIGKNKMKSWKAAVRTWERNTATTQPVYEQKKGISVAL